MRQASEVDVKNSGQDKALAFILQPVLPGEYSLKRQVHFGLALFFVLGSLMHFIATHLFASIIPPIFPFHTALVLITGALEMGFALALLLRFHLRLTGILLSLYLLAVLPANIYMALGNMDVGALHPGPALLWGRVILQFPLIALVLWATWTPDRLQTR